MADSNATLASAVRTGLIGLVSLAALAMIYSITDWLDSTATPYVHTIITGAIALALLGVGWLATREWKKFRARQARQSVPKAKGDRLSIVVAALRNDEQGEYAERIVLSLREQLGSRVEVLPVSEIVESGKRGNDEERKLDARKAGQDLLERTGCDVLIWGAALRADRILDLNFLARETSSSQNTQSYLLNQALRLPLEFGQDLGTALAAVAASAASAVVDERRYLVPVLLPIASRLHHLVETPPSSLHGNSLAEIFHAYALANLTIGDQTGEVEFLSRAIYALREAERIWDPEHAPLQWATVQNNLGNALATLGRRETGIARLEQAATAYRAALTVCTREHTLLHWAGVQNNLGNALWAIGEREQGTARLEEAAAVYREVLNEFTQAHMPVDRAMTLNNLGSALAVIGTREAGTIRLEEAVAVYHEALTGNTRELAPLLWASVQNNMGNALRNLGKRNNNSTQLKEAVSAFHDALQERTPEQVPIDWAITQNNLGNVLVNLSEHESGTARLEQAIIAYSAALVEFRKSAATFYIGVASQNLSEAEAALATRRAEQQ